MIPFSHPVWREFTVNEEACESLLTSFNRLGENIDDEEAWNDLWDDLHHQGTISQLAYASVPHILDIEKNADKFNWHGFALIAEIEHCRSGNKPPRDGEIADSYKKALREILAVVATHPDQIWDDKLAASILSCIAFSHGQRLIARVVRELYDEAARDWVLKNYNEDEDDISEYAASLL